MNVRTELLLLGCNLVHFQCVSIPHVRNYIVVPSFPLLGGCFFSFIMLGRVSSSTTWCSECAVVSGSMSKAWVEIRRMPDNDNDDDMVGISDGFCFLFWLRGFSRRSFLCIAQVSVRDMDVCEYSQQTLQQQLPKKLVK